MNERIKELLKKAQKITAENHVPGGRDYEREIYSKFAELIIRECVQAVYDDGQDAEYYQDRIKKHFGVEE